MNSILEKNLSSLKESNQFIKKYFEDQPRYSENQDGEVQVGVELIEDRKVLYAIKSGKQYQLDSLYHSTELLDKWFDKLSHANYRSRYLFFGLGNGMFVNKLLEKVEEEALILVVEPSKEIFITVMEEFDLSNILSDKRVLLTVNGMSELDLEALLTLSIGYDDFIGVVERNYLNYKTLFLKSFEEYEKTLTRYSDKVRANAVTACWQGQAQFDNAMANSAYLIKGKSMIQLREVIPKGLPGILVAAGPSLDKNIKELRVAKNRAFILAVDSAVNALLKAGIVPDAMVTCDAMKSGKYFWDPEVKKIPLIARVAGSRKLTVAHTGDKYFVNIDNVYVKEIFEQLNNSLPIIPSGGCVANDAYAILEYLQFETIIMVGQDLAYDEERNYAKDTLLGDMKVNTKAKRVLQVEGIHGEILNTEPAYCIYLNWFENEIKANSKISVVDATEGGAKIHGSTIMTLKDAIVKYCEKEVELDPLMKEIPEQLSKEEQTKVLEHFCQVPDKFRAVLKDVENLIRDYEKIWKLLKTDKSSVGELKKLLRKASEKSVEIEKRSIFFYVDNVMQQAVRNKFGDSLFAQGVGASEVEDSVKQAIDYFKLMKQEMKKIIPLGEEWVKAITDEELRKELSAESK